MTYPETPAGGGKLGTSTRASGPAGTHFEAQVAASYLLAMLSGAPPRGLPGTTIDKVALQQANTGHPLDDVVIHARENTSGKPAVLEIQVKLSITFSATDPAFRQVVSQIAKAAQSPSFLTQRHELAVATAKGSHKIDGAYQDVLMLARQVGDAASFAAQMLLPGAANKDMRGFVDTVKNHLHDAGLGDSYDLLWQVLRRFQILIFDFTAPGSALYDLAVERAVRILHVKDELRATSLWASLVEMAINMAKIGGAKNREMALQDLASQGYRFVGDTRNMPALEVLAEASNQALSDISNRVGDVLLLRLEWIASIREALEKARYVEVRGDAGVGKSGILRQMAETMRTEGHVIVLSPGRCVPRGWSAMRAQIGFDGSLRELLVELAANGGVTVFIDNLDSFSLEERRTVVDIVCEATRVPGITLVATARTEFGNEEPSWLPSEVMKSLGQTDPIVIGELNSTEIEQLIAADTSLSYLLTENHPARKVATNLFRLARLVTQPSSEPMPRTEVDMAMQWWEKADGASDGRRDRSRVLLDMTVQILCGEDVPNVKSHTATSIDSLVASGTLRDLGMDRVTFRHDVLQEWAIGNAIHNDRGLLDRMLLNCTASAVLRRGVELAARMAIERSADAENWDILYGRLSRPGIHRSWRRAALLALVRSEISEVLLVRALPQLCADKASLLRELVRTVMAVEVKPASIVFAAAGLDPSLVPDFLNIPSGPAWITLILWSLSLGDDIPNEAIPEFVQLYSAFSEGTFGRTDVTTLTTRQIYRWLRRMEPSGPLPNPIERSPFWHHLNPDEFKALKSDLRNAFYMFARSAPELAKEYINAIGPIRNNEQIIRSVFKNSGTLAHVAAAELADLTARALIEKPKPFEHNSDWERQKAFTYIEYEFVPASPSKGPFLELLTCSPKEGLKLVHRLVSHAVIHRSGGADPGTNKIVLALPWGIRSFPWEQTYFWSRYVEHSCVTSALMALEAWAHRRLDENEDFENVIKDVLGPPDSCAAYLLVAVDLIISHWPKSLDIAASFLACPELLCLDHTRKVSDFLEMPDLIGLDAMRKDSSGSVTVDELRQKPSRGTTLDQIFGNYIFKASSVQHSRLSNLLLEASARLEKPSADADLRDPEFMVQYALNLSDPSNWQEVEFSGEDGTIYKARKYVSPTKERNHLQALIEASKADSEDYAIQSEVRLICKNSVPLPQQRLREIVAWAQSSHFVDKSALSEDSDDLCMREEVILMSAMIAMRDGDETLCAEYGEWAHHRFDEALKKLNRDPACQVRSGLNFNPTAIAYAGRIYALQYQDTPGNIRSLLEVASNANHAAAHGFGSALVTLEAIDSRYFISILRCAFRSCIELHRDWNATKDERTVCRTTRGLQAKDAVQAEMEWLFCEGAEPDWPRFPDITTRSGRHLIVFGDNIDNTDSSYEQASSQSEYANYQAAAIWLQQAQNLVDDSSKLRLSKIIKFYMPWTIVANGGEMVDKDETIYPPTEWNNAFFSVAAQCIDNLTVDEISVLFIECIVKVPDRNFYDITAIFLPNLDSVYFERGNIQTSVAVAIREAFAEHMLKTRGWKRLVGSRDFSIEWHLAPAIAALFFNDHIFGIGSKCYLREKGTAQIDPFLPTLGHLTNHGPSPHVAFVLLNLLEVAPRREYLELLILAGKTWIEAFPDYGNFWLEYEVGRRWCLLIDAVLLGNTASLSHGSDSRLIIDSVVAGLISLGVSEASRLEEKLISI